ncbi:hypothetical protein JTE90_020730 [Oedothorax gibbosus]|uniref:COX assembly mitochondrial protein n=1 Tax=Oedothorax gibbosus TaxID=931172 RepID=A0AAV6V4S6_9ARAC|nr:hypothetical protein JTE90_020730 [Oedothorax gibbosus]
MVLIVTVYLIKIVNKTNQPTILTNPNPLVMSHKFPQLQKLARTSRTPQTESSVKFREEWPLKLKNMVSTRRGRTKEAACLNETLSFITCLKDNNNSHELCYKEGQAVQHCYHKYIKNQEMLRQKSKTAVDFVPEISAKDMDPVQLNRFLSHFPHKLKK